MRRLSLRGPVAWDWLEHAIVASALPTDDPLVASRELQVVPKDWKPRPVCDTCW